MKNTERLQKAQNFAVRIITGTLKFKHIMRYLGDLLRRLVAMQLEVRDITMTCNRLSGLPLQKIFTTKSEIYTGNTRFKDKLNAPLCRTAQLLFKYKVTSLWNSLPMKIQDTSSLDSTNYGSCLINF